MKKVFFILAGISAVAFLAFTGFAVWFINSAESEKRKAQTEPARNARWNKEKEIEQPKEVSHESNV